MFSTFVKNGKGQMTLLMVCAVSVVTSIFLFTAVDVFRRNYEFKAFDFDQALLNEVTLSSFAVAEAALERRLWEPPLDKDCLQAEKFEIQGQVKGDITWRVKAKYDFTTKNYELSAAGTYKNLNAFFKKRIKVLDVSDYLLFSNSDQTVNLSRRYDETVPSALIGRDRRLYMRGHLQLTPGFISRTNPGTGWSGSPPNWPGDFGTIIQGERMQFAGGISLFQRAVERPNQPAPGNLYDMLLPYSSPPGERPSYLAQSGSGYAVFTSNFNLASTLLKQVQGGNAGPLSYGSISNFVYPIALFSGTPPLKAWQAADSGTYFNEAYRQSVFTYAHAGANAFGTRNNYTCLARNGTNERQCSNSDDFPKGFSAWRRSAGLDGVLFTSDAEAIPAPTLSWENLNALEEDARQCGAVIDRPTNTYVDCPVWDQNFLDRYASGTSPNCQTVSRINLDSVSLSNFNPSVYENSKNRERFSRRVIYLKVPAEIAQSNARGLMMGRLSSPIARRNMPLWIVSEDMVSLKGFQRDHTSPLDSEPGRLREVVFNADAVQKGTPSETTPLSLVLFTPEQVHLLSPFYVPMSPTLMAASMPVSGGFIHPVRHNDTEYQRHENDGYRYGFRHFTLKNISLVTGTNLPASQPFLMRGLWNGGSDSSARQFIINQCMVSLAGHQLEAVAGIPLALTARVPSYHATANSPIPPPSSRFYGGRNQFSNIYYPAVFQVQQNVMSERQESEIDFTGLRIYTSFAENAPPGKRSLNSPLYKSVEKNHVTMDLSHKVITWDYGMYYQNLPPQTPCVPDMIRFRQHNPAAPTDPAALGVSVNNGRHLLIQSFPNESYRHIGAITGVEHPVVESFQSEDF